MSNSFKTTKGTTLPILNLKGKDYLQVMHRIVWFREEHPDSGIQTALIECNDTFCIFKAEIKDVAGFVVASSHGREDAKHFPDFIEKAETKAIGRALALYGYGTQFCADEINEGTRLADSPAPTVTASVAKKEAAIVSKPSPKTVNESYAAVEKGEPRRPTVAQLGRLHAIAKETGWVEEKLRAFLKDKLKIESSRDIPYSKYDNVVKYLQDNPQIKYNAK